jgi:hypothetical protein
VVANGANDGSKRENNRIKKQRFVEHYAPFLLLCVLLKTDVVLVLCRCLIDAQICILVGHVSISKISTAQAS